MWRPAGCDAVLGQEQLRRRVVDFGQVPELHCDDRLAKRREGTLVRPSCGRRRLGALAACVRARMATKVWAVLRELVTTQRLADTSGARALELRRSGAWWRQCGKLWGRPAASRPGGPANGRHNATEGVAKTPTSRGYLALFDALLDRPLHLHRAFEPKPIDMIHNNARARPKSTASRHSKQTAPILVRSRAKNGPVAGRRPILATIRCNLHKATLRR